MKVIGWLPLFILAGCGSTSSELNQCAQQNYQCISNCEQRHTEHTLGHQICNNECIDNYNSCKAQTEALLKKTTSQ